MNKIPKEEILSFRADISSILSQERLESYDGDIQSYYTNRLLALKAGHKIAEIEVYLRNMLDFCLTKLIGEDWIKLPHNLEITNIKGHTSPEELTSSQILSRLTLGKVIEFINTYKVEHYMLDLRDMDFKKYHWNNRNVGYVNGRKTHFSNVAKVEIALNLTREIRNRCFHWENLLKVTIKENGSIYPRITTIYPKNQIKNHQTRIGIAPEKILEFLDDLLISINNPTMKNFQNIEINYREI